MNLLGKKLNFYLFGNRRAKFLVLFLFVLFWIPCSFFSQIRTDEEPRRLYYQRTKRIKKFNEMKNMRDVLHLDKFCMGKRRFSGNISYQAGRVITYPNGVKSVNFRSSMAYFFRYRFYEEFYLNITFFRDFNTLPNAEWLGDFSFSVGRYNWRRRKWNFGYENFGNYKYSDRFSDFLQKFLQGYVYLARNFSSLKVNKSLKIDKTTAVHFTAFLRYAVQFKDENNRLLGSFFNGKPTGGFSFRYVILKNIYVESAIYAYLPGRKEPWDSDYTYGFGYFDWRPFHLSFTYGNWAINRFPWNNTRYPDYGFLDGNFRLTFNWVW